MDKAIEKTKVSIQTKYLPFPRYKWQQEKYKKELKKILNGLHQEKFFIRWG